MRRRCCPASPKRWRRAIASGSTIRSRASRPPSPAPPQSSPRADATSWRGGRLRPRRNHPPEGRLCRPGVERVEVYPRTDVRLRPVEVGEAVFAREAPRAVEAARLLDHPWIGGERRDRASDEARRLRRDEVRILLRAVAPVRFGDAEVIEHHLA